MTGESQAVVFDWLYVDDHSSKSAGQRVFTVDHGKKQ